MAKDRTNSSDYTGPMRRLLLAVLILILAAIFLLWRSDSPRVERFRAQITDALVPNLDWAMAPITGTVNLVRDFQSYQRLAEQNRELRRELRQRRKTNSTDAPSCCMFEAMPTRALADTENTKEYICSSTGFALGSAIGHYYNMYAYIATI